MRKRNNNQLRIIFGSAITISAIRLTFLLTKIDIGLFMDVILFLSGCIASYLLYRSRTRMSFVGLILNSLILTTVSIIVYEFSRGIIIKMPISFNQILNRIFVSANVVLIFTIANLIVALLCKTKSQNDNDIIDEI